MGLLLRCLPVFLLLIAAAIPLRPALAEKRVALVIGINDYPRLKVTSDPLHGQLRKAVSDAETMAETLRRLGFEVEIGRNVNRAAFLAALDSFKRRIEPGDTAFVFYAGHGIALKGSNLLLPSDMPPVDPESEQLIRGLSVAETDIIDVAREKGAALTILVLDACRNNPIEEFARAQAQSQGRAFRSTSVMRSAGLDIRPTKGIFAIYSAGFGQLALDGLNSDTNEPNSVFTRVFARKIMEPGRHLPAIMEDVREEVARLALNEMDPRTRKPHLQYPSYYNETLGGKIFLAGREGVVGASPTISPISVAQGDDKLATLPLSPLRPVRCDHPYGDYVVVNVSRNDLDGGLIVRQRPDVSAEAIGVIPANGTGIGMGNCVGTWCSVRYECLTGWVSKQFLDRNFRRLARVVNVHRSDILKIRRAPRPDFPEVGGIPSEETGIVVHGCERSPSNSTEWCNVTYGELSGWVNSYYLKPHANE